jgi:hypothetical protein
MWIAPPQQRDASPRMNPGRIALKRRVRKLIGAFFLFVLPLVWALLAMAIAQGRIAQAASIWQWAYYVVAGLGWVIPAGLLISWMEKPDRT